MTPANCEHRYLTVQRGSGWMCADCGVPVLSLMVPIPLPLVAQALKAAGMQITEANPKEPQ